ncbi:hypothetical protein BT96DRAFT_548463 [Gymnopus androsaceus JB14]|uniref:Uncharacterized protein n=1 Tax=Gymnopus androsaceus JB14 TaxID=1447944 RepID=A0A6A4HZX8_9AGAR|nr:hypothetical protein BT96DRAFT_548463 [Gymnopus androsaceus JB14]
MAHSKNSSTSTTHTLLPESSHSYHVVPSEDEYYRSTASSTCSSPFPQSGSDSESDEMIHNPLDLQLIIATTSETQLRATMLKLASSSTLFRHAIAKELHSGPSSPQTVRTKSRSRRCRTQLQRSSGSGNRCPPLPTCLHCRQVFDGGDSLDVCFYHPGQLDDEVFEFLSQTPEGRSFKILKTISMWSCCEEEPGSIGCFSAPIHEAELGRNDV